MAEAIVVAYFELCAIIILGGIALAAILGCALWIIGSGSER